MVHLSSFVLLCSLDEKLTYHEIPPSEKQSESVLQQFTAPRRGKTHCPVICEQFSNALVQKNTKNKTKVEATVYC